MTYRLPTCSSASSSRRSRRLKIIPNGFGEKPVLKLMFGPSSVPPSAGGGLRFTKFELRQIAAGSALTLSYAGQDRHEHQVA